MNPNLKFLVQIIVNINRGDQERSTTVSVQPSVKHSGGVIMGWGSILASGFGDFVKTDQIMIYLEIV